MKLQSHLLTKRGVSDLQVVPFQVSESDLASMNSLNIDSLGDPGTEEFMNKYSQLWGGTPDHGYDWLMRGTQLGQENYFSTSVAGKLDFGSGQ